MSHGSQRSMKIKYQKSKIKMTIQNSKRIKIMHNSFCIFICHFDFCILIFDLLKVFSNERENICLLK